MKKMYAVLLVLCVGILFAGVNCGSETTEIGWIDGSGGTAISDIVWFDGNNDQQNQVWNETIDDGTSTDRTTQKEVTKTTGYAECVVGGVTKRIFANFDDSGLPKNGGTVNEGSATYYTINSAQ